jgi:hypothetical protein
MIWSDVAYPSVLIENHYLTYSAWILYFVRLIKRSRFPTLFILLFDHEVAFLFSNNSITYQYMKTVCQLIMFGLKRDEVAADFVEGCLLMLTFQCQNKMPLVMCRRPVFKCGLHNSRYISMILAFEHHIVHYVHITFSTK